MKRSVVRVSCRSGGWRAWSFLSLGVALLLLCLPVARAYGVQDRLDWLLPEDPLEGGKLFVQKGCVQCHAIYGEGGQGGPDLGKTKVHRGFLEVAGVMWNHSPRMEEEFRRLKIVRPKFTAEEMAEIIAFVYFLNYFDRPGDPDRGERLFTERGCRRCHSVGGVGGNLAEPLDRYRRYVSAVFISTGMWNNGLRMAEEMRRLGVPRPVFQKGDVRDILAFIREKAIYEPDESRVFLPPGNPRNGRRLFREKRCADCHAIRSSRWSPGPDLGRVELRGNLSTIAGFQWNHGPAMWKMMQRRGIPIPRFTELEMSDVVTYLYFIQYAEEPGDPTVGARLFSEKGCSSCHSMSPESPAEGPSVTEMEPFQAPADVIAAMWNHASEMELMTWEKNVVWPILKEAEMANLVAFLLSASTASTPEKP